MTDDNQYFKYRNTVHWLVMQPWATRSAVKVYEVLSDQAHFKTIFMGMTEISKKAGMDYKTAKRSVKLLRKHELINKTIKHRADQSPSGYELLKPMEMSEIKGVQGAKKTRVNNVYRQGSEKSSNRGQKSPLNKTPSNTINYNKKIYKNNFKNNKEDKDIEDPRGKEALVKAKAITKKQKEFRAAKKK
jgi:predicted transcriptional regulator